MADIRIKDPITVDRKAACEKGYFLIQPDACINQDALTHIAPQTSLPRYRLEKIQRQEGSIRRRSHTKRQRA